MHIPSAYTVQHSSLAISYSRPICNSAYHYIFVLWFLLSICLSIYLSFSFFPRLIPAVADWMSYIYFHTWCGPSTNLECRSEMCWTRFAGKSGRKKSPKIRHLRTIAQLCGAISLQPRHISTIGKKLVKQQYLLHMSLQYGELKANSWDLLASLAHPN